MEIALYSTGCPKCEVLKSKLDEKGILYETVTDIEQMKKRDIATVPVLEVDGEMMAFRDAVTWTNSRG